MFGLGRHLARGISLDYRTVICNLKIIHIYTYLINFIFVDFLELFNNRGNTYTREI